MTQAAKGQFETAVFRCANGDSSPGVRAVNGPAVCWCSEQADAELIAKALNQYNRITLQTVLEPLGEPFSAILHENLDELYEA